MQNKRSGYMDRKLRTAIGVVFPDYKKIRFEWRSLMDTFMLGDWDWLVEGLKPNTTAFDFGSGIGDTTILMAKQPQVGRVISLRDDRGRYKAAKCPVKKQILAQNNSP